MNQEKEKLFKSQNVLDWRLDTSDLMIEAEKVKHDPIKAYPYILPDVINFKLKCAGNKAGGGNERGGGVFY